MIFKKQTKEAKQGHEIAELAANIQNQDQLNKILRECATPQLREGVLLMLLPLLPFAPDCIHCGARRGGIYEHGCLMAPKKESEHASV